MAAPDYSILYMSTVVSCSVPLTKQPKCFELFTKRKNLAVAKLKGFADDKINVTQKLKIMLGRVEYIVEKEENAGT